MADNRCPLCMEKLKHGECVSCGYKLPDEENLSQVYDAEPSSYPEPIREITPEIQMEEIYPNREEVPKFKVRTDDGRTVKVDLSKPKDNSNEKAEDANPYAINGNPYASNGNPYAGYTPEGVPNESGSPFANKPANQYVDTDSMSAFWKQYWWLVVLSFFIPLIGVILYATMKQDLKKYKASYLVIVAAVLGFIIPP